MFKKPNNQVSFHLTVRSSQSSAVWPMRARNVPEIDKRIEETYYADPDEATASLEISDMDDLLFVLDFYRGEPVTLSLIAKVTTPEFETSAVLSHKHGRNQGTVRHIEKDALSPEAAAGKLRAMAGALLKWNEAKEKGDQE